MHGHYDLLGSLVIFPTVGGPGAWTVDTRPGPSLRLNIALSGNGTESALGSGHPSSYSDCQGSSHLQNDIGHGDEILNFKVL